MSIGSAVTQFPTCPACGREGRAQGPYDWNCSHCRAVIERVEETNEAGDNISHWAIKMPPNEGVVEALARGEDPFVHRPPTFDPYGHAKDLIHQRQAILSEGDESITLGDLAKELGANCQELVKLGRTMGLFAEDKGGPRTQLTYDQFTKLQHMWGIAIARHQGESAEQVGQAEDKWQTGGAEEVEVVEEPGSVEAEA